MTISGHMLRMAAASLVQVPDEPGTPFKGGYYAGRIMVGSQQYALIAAPRSVGESNSLTWKSNNNSTPGTASVNDGMANTLVMTNGSQPYPHPAAEFCRSLSINGFDDWYLPARDELEILYRNLKSFTDGNSASSGVNLNSVPPGAPYTSSDPAQTSSPLFIQGGSEAFSATYYFCSTQESSGRAFVQLMSNGQQTDSNKNQARYVRAVRREPI